MSRLPPRSSPRTSPRTSLVAPDAVDAFDEIDLTLDGTTAQLRHAAENSYAQLAVLGAATAAFVLFVAAVVPLMKLTWLGNLIWVLVAVVVLATVGLASQARLRVATLRLTPGGIELDQGTLIDREHAAVAWGELAGVELEAVDPEDGRKGMQLRLSVRGGEPIDAFAGLGLGDLNAARHATISAWRAGRANG